MSHETIYQSLFVQGRGGLRKELHPPACARAGRSAGPTAAPCNGPGQIPDMVMISERPAEVEDRAVPGHWEGDLIIGTGNQSAIGTLVERTTRFVMLVAPARRPHRRARSATRSTAKIQTLPAAAAPLAHLGPRHRDGRARPVHHRHRRPGLLLRPAQPLAARQQREHQRLLRQYFPKGTDLSGHTQADLDAVAAELNGRPRQTLGWMTPSSPMSTL